MSLVFAIFFSVLGSTVNVHINQLPTYITNAYKTSHTVFVAVEVWRVRTDMEAALQAHRDFNATRVEARRRSAVSKFEQEELRRKSEDKAKPPPG